MAPEKASEAYQRYGALTGGLPALHDEVTLEQMRAMHALLGGQGPPYAGFQCGAPFGHRVKMNAAGQAVGAAAGLAGDAGVSASPPPNQLVNCACSPLELACGSGGHRGARPEVSADSVPGPSAGATHPSHAPRGELAWQWATQAQPAVRALPDEPAQVDQTASLA